MKARNFLATITMITAIATFSVVSRAGSAGGGGGGGFCFPNGKCITLAEAGLKIKETSPNNPAHFDLKPELVKELRTIVSTLPWNDSREEMIRGAVGELNTFRIVETLDKQRFDKAYKEYQALLKVYSPELDPKQLVFYAYSDSTPNLKDRITYLLPHFSCVTPQDSCLSIRDQALILIHEDRRRAGFSLIDALKFDIQFSNWLDANDKGATGSFDTFKLAYYANKLGWLDDRSLPIFAIEKIENESGKILGLLDLCPDAAHIPLPNLRPCVPSRETLINLGTADKRIPQVFEKAEITAMFLKDLYVYRHGVSQDHGDHGVEEQQNKCSKTDTEWVYDRIPLNLSEVSATIVIKCDHQKGVGMYNGINLREGGVRTDGPDAGYFWSPINNLNYLPLLAD